MEISPVLQLSFNRARKTASVLECLSMHGAEEIYISVDGPRETVQTDIDNVREVKLVIAEFTHKHQVEVRYRSRNEGLRYAVESALDWFFSRNEFGIIIEDDIVFDQKFLIYCSANQFALKNPTIATISGNNLLAHLFPDLLPPIFRMAQIFHCWGWATTKSVWYDYRKFTRLNGDKTIDCLVRLIEASSTLKPSLKSLWVNMAKMWISEQSRSWAFPFMIYCIANDLRHLTPPCNLSSNSGFDESATNTKFSFPCMKNIQIGQSFDGGLISNTAYVDHSFDEIEYRFIMGCSE